MGNDNLEEFSRRLLLFGKLPVPGRVKTRLALDLGSEIASRFAAAMLVDRISNLLSVKALRIFCGDREDASLFFPYLSRTGFHSLSQRGRIDGRDSRSDVERWYYTDQGSGSRGQRLCISMTDALCSAKNGVVLVGSDAPAQKECDIQAAFDHVNRGETVLQASSDGGFCLLGLPGGDSNLAQRVLGTFRSADSISFKDLKIKLESLGKSPRLLEPVNDIDDLRDLQELLRQIGSDPHLARKLPIIRHELEKLPKDVWRLSP